MSLFPEDRGPHPSLRVYSCATFRYIRLSELPQHEQEPFGHWLYGRTLPWFEGLDPQDAAFLGDYECWQRELVVGPSNDWD